MVHFYWAGALLIALLSAPAHAQPMMLSNHYWTVEVKTSALTITAIIAGGSRVVAAQAGHVHRVSGRRYVADGAVWEWGEGTWQIQFRLQGRDLLRWTRMGQSGYATPRRLSAIAAELPLLQTTRDACAAA